MEYLKDKQQINKLEEYVNNGSEWVDLELKHELFKFLEIEHSMTVDYAHLSIKPFNQYNTFQVRVCLIDKNKSMTKEYEKSYTITKNNIFDSYPLGKATSAGILWWFPMNKTPIENERLRKIYNKIVPEIKKIMTTL